MVNNMKTNYNMFGIRFDDRELQIGEELSRSNRFDGGMITNEELPGTCSIFVSDERDFLDYIDGKLDADCGELDAYNDAINASYPGKHIYLVAIDATWGYEWGEDEHEIIMNGAEVIRVIK